MDILGFHIQTLHHEPQITQVQGSQASSVPSKHHRATWGEGLVLRSKAWGEMVVQSFSSSDKDDKECPWLTCTNKHSLIEHPWTAGPPSPNVLVRYSRTPSAATSAKSSRLSWEPRRFQGLSGQLLAAEIWKERLGGSLHPSMCHLHATSPLRLNRSTSVLYILRCKSSFVVHWNTSCDAWYQSSRFYAVVAFQSSKGVLVAVQASIKPDIHPLPTSSLPTCKGWNSWKESARVKAKQTHDMYVNNVKLFGRVYFCNPLHTSSSKGSKQLITGKARKTQRIGLSEQ